MPQTLKRKLEFLAHQESASSIHTETNRKVKLDDRESEYQYPGEDGECLVESFLVNGFFCHG